MAQSVKLKPVAVMFEGEKRYALRSDNNWWWAEHKQLCSTDVTIDYYVWRQRLNYQSWTPEEKTSAAVRIWRTLTSATPELALIEHAPLSPDDEIEDILFEDG